MGDLGKFGLQKLAHSPKIGQSGHTDRIYHSFPAFHSFNKADRFQQNFYLLNLFNLGRASDPGTSD